ncbi:MAG: FkbM family methyltransferase [Candidatus Delongbacteria bacterium]
MLKDLCIRLVGRAFWADRVTFWTELHHALLPPRTRGMRIITGQLVRRGDTVLDVGANIGRITHALARAVGPAGRVHAFEPTPMARRVLEALVKLRRLRQVTVVPAAVGREDGRLELLIPLKDNWKPMHQITHRAGDGGEEGLRLEVPLLSLDTYWKQQGEPDISLIKCDTEGQELFVLQGARELLARCHPALFCEVEAPYLERSGHRPEDIFAFVGELGYQALRADSHDQLVTVAGYEARCCYFFLHPERWPAGLTHLRSAQA